MAEAPDRQDYREVREWARKQMEAGINVPYIDIADMVNDLSRAVDFLQRARTRAGAELLHVATTGGNPVGLPFEIDDFLERLETQP